MKNEVEHNETLLQAISKGELDAVKAAIDSGANPEYKSYQGTPLIEAIKALQPDIVDLLITQYQVNPLQTDYSYKTPYFHAQAVTNNTQSSANVAQPVIKIYEGIIANYKISPDYINQIYNKLIVHRGRPNFDKILKGTVSELLGIDMNIINNR